jgi:hypothetical protein
MKKSLVVIGAIVLMLILAAFTLPLIFKDSIKKTVDESIAKSVKAEVSYEDFSLSLFKRFPNLSLSIENLSIVGREPFHGDTLLVTDQLTVSVNPIRALYSDKLEVNIIEITRPRLQILVLEDGSANYHIGNEDTSVESESPDYQFGIRKWHVEQGSLIYHDQSTEAYLSLEEINHTGSGNFSKELFDLTTFSEIKVVDLEHQGIACMSNKEVTAEVTMEMNLPQATYTFKENQISINEFAFGFSGWLTLPKESDAVHMDVSFATKQNEFVHLLSCVPGMYKENFENIKANGLVTMNGSLQGTYHNQQVPAFQFALKVEDGMFQYPELPTSVNHINLDLEISNEDGRVDNTLIDISAFSLTLGDKPLTGNLRIDGLSSPEIKAALATELDLAQLTTIFPIEGTTIRGNYQLSLAANGVYDSAAQSYPIVDASMRLKDGYIKSEQFPESLENFNLTSRVTNHSGYLPDTRIEIPEFKFTLDDEPFSGQLTLVNPLDLSWDLVLNGGVDLEKLTRILSLENMELKGLIRGKLTSRGNMSSLEAEKYAEIPTTGEFTIQQFTYSGNSLDLPLEITTGAASFNPQQIVLTDVQILSGSTDLNINGEISNYLNYLLQDAPIAGRLDVASDHVDLNEWMTDTRASNDTPPLSVLELPTNVELNLQASAGTVLYDNMNLQNASGQVIIKKGQAELHNFSFNSLGGDFLISGIYDPRDLKQPKFDMGIEMQQVGIKEAFNTFNTVRAFAPVAQLVKGNFSSNFKVRGELQPGMMPNLSTVSATGLVNIATAALSAMDSKLVQGFAEMTRFSNSPSEFSLKDVVIAVKIDSGQLEVAPFTTHFGEYKTLVSGSTGIDGTMNYMLNMEVPAGVIGTSVNQAIAKLTGSNRSVDDKLNLNIKVTGTYTEPSFKLAGVQGENTTSGLAKSAAEDTKQDLKDSVESLANQQTQKLTDEAQKQLDSLFTSSAEDSSSNEALKDAAKELVKKEKVDEVLKLFKKKKTKE